MTSDFPPVVPCKGECAYADECTPSWSDPYGCGTCCRCQRMCHLECDVERAYTPETPQQAEFRKQWEKAREGGPWRL